MKWNYYKTNLNIYLTNGRIVSRHSPPADHAESEALGQVCELILDALMM